jgi:hypothetical protein
MSEEVKSESEKKKEDWMNSKWRPMMGWMYMMVCMCDFILFPVLWSLLHAVLHTANMTQWNPLTLQGAGLFHIAMGAVLGIAAFGRTQEKLGGANNGGIQAPATGFASGAPAFGAPSSGFGAAPGGFGSPAPSTSFAPAPSWGTTPVAAAGGFGAPATGQVVAGFGGKPAPIQPEQPQI